MKDIKDWIILLLIVVSVVLGYLVFTSPQPTSIVVEVDTEEFVKLTESLHKSIDSLKFNRETIKETFSNTHTVVKYMPDSLLRGESYRIAVELLGYEPNYTDGAIQGARVQDTLSKRKGNNWRSGFTD